MHRHDLGALFCPHRDLFSENPSDEQETAVGEVHTPIQADGWEEQVAIQDHGWDEVADDEVELARALGTEISQDFELALEQPATIASMCARACIMNLTDQGGRTRALKTGRPSKHQRTTSSVRQSESQSIGTRQTTAIDDICLLVT